MSTTFYDFIATTAVFRSPASTLLRSLGTHSPCSGSHKCYDVTSTFVVTSPTAPASSVAPAAESPCSGSLTCYHTCMRLKL